MAFELVSPELDDTAQVKLADDLMALYQSVHICLKTMFSVNALLVKFDLDEAVGVRADYEVDLCPVHHDDLLDIVYKVGKLTRDEAFETTILLRWTEITVQNLLFVEPLRSKELLFGGLVGVIMNEVGHHIVLLLLLGQEAIVVLPVILIHASIEGTRCYNALFSLSFLPLILFVFKEHGIFIR